MNLRQYLGYYFLASYHRKCLDKLLAEYSHLYHGVVLDIGGRDRGKFKSPKEQVTKWIIADIEESRKPDIVLDVCNMKNIHKESIDVVNALELFEHVENPEKGLLECFRILKQNGTFIISVPFLYPIHADPCDFQRWTKEKWDIELKRCGFKPLQIIPMGSFFTVLADMLKSLNSSIAPVKYFGMIIYPFFDLLTKLDKTKFIQNNKRLNSYTTGYFIISVKQ